MLNGTEKGAQEWDTLVTWLNAPPAQRASTMGATRVSGASRAAALRAQAEAAVGSEGTAFDAYASALGR